MREILFRGQHIKYGQKVNMLGEKLPGVWVYGGIFPGTGDYSIIYGGKSENFTAAEIDKWPVYSETVGQYTGLTDKNGKKIFEGDIVKGIFLFGEQILSVVKFSEGSFGLAWQRGNVEEFSPFTGMCNVEYEIIGNCHDNPELLKGGNT